MGLASAMTAFVFQMQLLTTTGHIMSVKPVWSEAAKACIEEH